MAGQEPLFQKTCMIGIGLIGASLALAMRKNRLCDAFSAYARAQATRDKALALGIVDTAPDDVAAALQGCDLIVLAVPVGAMAELLTPLNQHAPENAIVMDVGSVKEGVIASLQGLREDLRFVPAHPIAGTEQSGPAAGFATLFEDRWSILTPTEATDKAALEAVRTLWARIGAKVTTMSASHHDMALAVTSHIPHLIAFTLVGAADDVEGVQKQDVITYAAGGFRDFTRIASSDPTMWRDVFLQNKEAVLEVLGRFSEELSAMQRAIRWGDGETLERAFSRARQIRQQIIDAGEENADPNFGRNRHSQTSKK